MYRIQAQFVILLHFYALTFGQFFCPRNNQTQPIDGAYRDPNNCNIYYHCINGTSSIQSCPPGYHFQIRTDSCKFVACVPQQTSDCQQKSTEFDTKQISNVEEIKVSAEDDIDECEPKNNETVQHFNDCRLYYHCYNGIAWPQRCPTGYFFSPKVDLKRCVYQFCVPYYEADCPIDGQWSSWSTWSNCTGDCGEIGTRKRIRECNNPPPINEGKCCDGDSSQTEFCQLDVCQNSTSFSVSFRNNQVVNTGKVNWTKIDVITDLFDPETQSLNIKKSGFYFFSLTASVESGNEFKLSHRIGYTSGISTVKMNLTKDTISREYGMLMSPIYKSYIQQESQAGDVLIGSENGKETSWSGFYYDTNTYLYATTDEPILPVEEINFTIIQMNGFNRLSSSRFKSLSTGFFYVSMGIGIQPNNSGFAKISRGNRFNIFYIYYRNRMNTSYSQTNNLILNATLFRPEFHFLKTNVSFDSSRNHQTYMSVFKLHKSKPMVSAKSTLYSGFATNFSKVYFSNIRIVDNFQCWNIKESIYKVPLTGNYYVSFNMPLRFNFGKESALELRANNETLLRAATEFKDPKPDSRIVSNSAVLFFKKNDKVELFYKGDIINGLNEGSLNMFFIN